MRYAISLALLLAVLWLSISGVYKPVILLLGAGSIALVVWLSHRMRVIGEEHNPGLFSWRLPLYWAWLVWQIVLANLQLARRILTPNMGLASRVVRVPLTHSSDVSRVTYAQSITLTPGTVSLLLDGRELMVHVLTPEALEGLTGGEMDRRVHWLEGTR